MSMTTTPPRVEGADVVVLQTPTLQWVLKRALLGLVILFVVVTVAATLLYASIEPETRDDGPLGATTSSASPPPVAAPLPI